MNDSFDIITSAGPDEIFTERIRMKVHNLFLFVIFLLSPLMSAGCATIQKHYVLSPDDVVIRCDVQGRGKPALVFVHGWCGDKRYWSYQVPYFAQRYKVVAIDLGGHGASGLNRRRWSMKAFGADVAAVIEMLKLNQVILIGHSMGGNVIIEAARLEPDRVIALVGVDTYHDVEAEYPRNQIEEFVDGFMQNFKKEADKFARDMFPPDSDPNIVERVVEDMSSAPPWVGISALQEYFFYDVKEALKDVRVPIYCINTDLVPTNVEAGRRHAVSFDVKLMPGLSHFIMIEEPKTFNKLLEETISEIIITREYSEDTEKAESGQQETLN